MLHGCGHQGCFVLLLDGTRKKHSACRHAGNGAACESLNIGETTTYEKQKLDATACWGSENSVWEWRMCCLIDTTRWGFETVALSPEDSYERAFGSR
jgi:hypothetical protein